MKTRTVLCVIILAIFAITFVYSVKLSRTGLNPPFIAMVLIAVLSLFFFAVTCRFFALQDQWLRWIGSGKENTQPLRDVLPTLRRCRDELLIACRSLNHETYNNLSLAKSVEYILSQGATVRIIFDRQAPEADNPFLKLAERYKKKIEILQTVGFQLERYFLVVTDQDLVRIEEKFRPEEVTRGTVLKDKAISENLALAFENYLPRCSLYVTN